MFCTWSQQKRVVPDLGGTASYVEDLFSWPKKMNTVGFGWKTGESNMAVADGLFHRTNNLYYRFLNCGFRLGVSGGSAIGVMPVPTGHNRAYAKFDEPMTAEKFWEAVKAGRSFATTGPMITLTADGHSMGASLSRTSKETNPIRVRATVRSIEALEALQIIHNGSVVASVKLLGKQADPVLLEELNQELIPKRSGWIAAQALYRAKDGLLRQAHTSPIYIAIDNKPVAFADDANYMLRWINVLDDITRKNPDRFPSTSVQEAVLANYAEARAKYLEIMQYAQFNCNLCAQ